ncbi:MAG: tetratricopeptide repeat protein [Verrucomicrobiales bacterium]|nr:tetratricopeptide repeat protein [Verrucomicrobiales bacterium]
MVQVLLLALAGAGILAGQEVDRKQGEALTANELLSAGEAAFLNREFGKAERLLGQFLEDYGKNDHVADQAKLVKPLLALVRVRLEKFEEARELIEEAIVLDTTTPAQKEELEFWRGIAALKAGDHVAAQEGFGAFYADTSHVEWRRTEALILFGTTDVLQGEPARAAAFFGSQMERLRERSPEAAGRAVILQLHALMESGEEGGALELLRAEYPRMGEITQLVSFQSLAVALGATFLEQGDYYDAIACLQRVWSKERLMRHQGKRLVELKGKVRVLKERGNQPELVFQYDGMVGRLEREIEAFGTTESFDASVRLRLATAFRGLGRFRESALILEEMLERMDPDVVVEQAALALVQSWMQIERWPRAIAAAEKYEVVFGGRGLAKSLALVVFLKAECEQQRRELGAAAAGYGRVFTEWPKSELAAKAFFMQGMVRLMADENDEAIGVMQAFRERFGKPGLVEDSVSWEGMGRSFGKEHGLSYEVMGDYLERYPKGKYVEDAEFRRVFCRHSEAYYDEAIAGFREFIEAREGSNYVDEARLLLGDALGAVGEVDEAIAAYRSIGPGSKRFFEDGWFKIGKALWLTERTEEMRAHFEEFIETYPASFRVAEAVYEIGKIDVRGGEVEKAKAVYWKTLREIGDEPEAYAIEDILVALTKLYTGERVLSALSRDFDELRRWAEGNEKAVLVVRAHWGKAKAMQRFSPQLAAVSMVDAGSMVDPKWHNPRVTVDCADARRLAGKPLVAGSLYREARKWHPRSPDKDRMYAGLGFLARDAGRRAEAVEWFEKTEVATFRPALRAEVMLETAKLHAERVPHLAREVLERLLGDKAIGSEAKAGALYLYAQILEAEGSKKKSLAYYERIYVAYGKYRDLVAAAYYRRGEVLEELAMREQALEVYRELVGREELRESEEVKLAEKRLSELEGAVR